MDNAPANRSVEFFDAQFKRQIASHSFDLNPFEEAILPFIQGRVLDLGCGLGNLSMAAARKGSVVLAIDASTSAIDALNQHAHAEKLPITAEKHDLASYEMAGQFDAVLCVGLLMFFAPGVANAWLERICAITSPNGIAAINVLISGTTYLDMFDESSFTLFEENSLKETFQDWQIAYSATHEFAAPGGTVKRFFTIVARKF